MTFANTSDVAAELGRPIPSDSNIIAQWNRWLTRIENQILHRIPDLMERVADGVLSGDLVGDIEAAAVARKVLNPEGLRQSTKTIDDGSVTKIVDSARSVGEVGLLDEEWDLLLGESDGAFSIRTASAGTPAAFYNDPWPNRGLPGWS